MKIFLTGGAGMLGQAVQRLAHDTVIVYAPTRKELDLTNRQGVRDYFARHSFDAVIHCAAKVGGIAANIADPVGFFTENMLLSTYVIDEARRAGVKNLINIGSSCMYPRDYNGALKEDAILAAPLEPTNECYALAKISAAKLCTAISEQYGLHYRTFIPCNLYGVGDKYDLANGHMMAAAIVKIHHAKSQEKQSVEIWGDGSARREFVYVDDVADFILKSIGQLGALPAYLNLGLGHDYTVLDYYHMIADVVGYKGNFTHNLSAPVGMNHKLMDITLSQKFGWNPQTSVTDGVQRAYESYCHDAGV